MGKGKKHKLIKIAKTVIPILYQEEKKAHVHQQSTVSQKIK